MVTLPTPGACAWGISASPRRTTTAVIRVQFLYGTQETFAVTDDGARTGSEPVSEGHYLDQIPTTNNEEGVSQCVKGTKIGRAHV